MSSSCYAMFKHGFDMGQIDREIVIISRNSILVNCSPTSEFSSERGIRQGDPLTPYLISADRRNFKSTCKTSS